MEFRHEIINFPKKLPINFFLHRIGNVSRHWHQSLELIVVMKGEVDINVNNVAYRLEAGDLILINSNEVHELHSEDATMVALQIKLELLKEVVVDIKKMYFDCNTANTDHPEMFRNIKRIVAQILQHNINASEYVDLINASLVYELIFELCSHFSSDEQDRGYQPKESLDRLRRILDYINSHYADNISLQEVAKNEYLSVPYLSKYFKKKLGLPFSEYLKDLRLHYAVNDLLNESLTIDKIATKNGFPNVRSFVTAFAEKHGELPSIWRKKHAEEVSGSIETTKEKSVNYYQDEPHSYYEEISRFIENNLGPHAQYALPEKNKESLSSAYQIDLSRTGEKLHHHFKKFIGVSRVKEVLYADVQEALRITQQEIGFEYIKMHGLLDDDLMVYHEDSAGRPSYNFQLIDKAFDFLLSVGLRPLVQFSFMPAKLASESSKTVFYSEMNTSPPKDMNKWNKLIEALTIHLINRYGIAEVRNWLFCVWNEPSSSNLLFGFKRDETFFSLYKNTYQTVKSIDPSLLFGGPAAFSTYNKNEDWLFSFLDFSRDHECLPDFITIHYYDIDLMTHDDKLSMDKQLNLSPVTDSFKQFIDRLQFRLQEVHLADLPVYLTEWNSTVSHKDLMSDTCFKSSYVIKNITENYDRLDSFGYWLLTDLHEENRLPSQLFHGGLGLFTWNNIKKPAYYSFYFLNRLGNELVDRGDGYFITRQDDCYQILLYNYHHYDDVYSKGISISISSRERYSHFPSKTRREFRFDLGPLSGDFQIKHSFVNRSYGSAYDNALSIIQTDEATSSDIDYLKQISIPRIEKELVTSSDALTVQATLEPFEIRLIEVSEILKYTPNS
ncbi:helix-turn-helix domain-containing protein [Paenibacillus sp. FSL R5-0407]|uniref:GH39 family glycosyl hydrolase n=1 Tax=Paenibacillus TaxID=44249 RepID=UPI0025B6A16E|nr:helix-turn-helix domain-containing protein [Paenibacillus vini]MDN4068208.1 helix-turn-helix domain-containing protein [Paenibacillus vini]